MHQGFDPLEIGPPEQRQDPYPVYRALRDHAPLHRAASGVYTVSRYDDVMEVLKTPELFSSRAMFTLLMAGGDEKMPPLDWKTIRFLLAMVFRARLNPLEFATARNLISEDGESHAQLRAIVNRGFTPRQISSLTPRVHDIVEECLAPIRDGADFDLVRDLAVPLPMVVIAEMLGVERDRLADFKHWSDMIIDIATGPGRDDRFAPRYREGMIAFIQYLKGIAQDRRRNPRDDIVSTIVASQDGGPSLSDREVVQFGLLLLVAGNETTTNLIANGTTALLAHPEAQARVAADPSWVPALIEETLRYDTPVQVVFRNALADFDIAGGTIPKGAMVAALLGSANRDERRFDDPDRFDLDRDTKGHVGFGFGAHFCLGASLARLEATAAFEALAPMLPAYDGPAVAPERVPSFLVRGPTQLPLRRAA